MSDPKLDPVLGGALDRFTVPGLPADFANRVVEAALARNAEPLPKPMPRRLRRTGWMRGHRVIIGAMAVGLMSAAAAATAIFADNPRNVPIIGPIIASVAPAKPAPKPKVHKAPASTKLAAAKLPEVQPQAEAAPPTLATPVERRLIRREVRREIIAEKLVRRAEFRAERRAELGLPPRAVRPGQIVPVLRRLPPGERAAIVERAMEIRQERRAAIADLPQRTPQADAPALAPEGAPDTAAPAGESGGDAQASAPEALRNPDRIEQLRRLRLLRELQQRRRELRRQRQP